MPTYDYRCKKCGHEFEIQQSFSDDALTKCPECKGELRKVFSAVGISFKGSGFYKTDSRGASSASTTSATGSGDSSSSSTGTDSTTSASTAPSSTTSKESSGSSTPKAGTSDKKSTTTK